MNRLVPITAVAIAAAFVAPAAMATWMSGGTYEPDSQYDSANFGWSDAPGAVTNRIYFNTYQTVPAYGSGTADPNVAALRTQFTSSGNLYFEAHFGVWTDCNDDGYIGHFESALREYPSQLLLGKDGPGTKCAAKTGSASCWTQMTGTPLRCPAWPHTGYNNYNGWVTELIPIVRTNNGGDIRVIYDPDAAVWGDFGIPVAQGDEFTTGTGSASCPLTPLPRGFWSQTGGAIDYVDCLAGHVGGRTYNTVANTLNQPALPPLADEDTWIEPGHPLNQETFGSGKATDAMVTAQDCKAQPIYKNESQGIYVYPAPADPVNPSGSIAGSFNATTESTREGCKPSENDRGDFYATLGEGDQAESASDRKTESDLNFVNTVMSRGGAPLGALTGRAGNPSDAGIDALGGGLIVTQTEWQGNVTYVGNTPGLTEGRLTRGNVTGTADGSNPYRLGDARLANASYATFYAKVGSASTGRGLQTPGGSAIYGAPFCSNIGPNAGIHYGWECDDQKWYKLENGLPVSENLFRFARPGDSYQFRDVDCWDGSFSPDEGETEYGIEPAFYGSYEDKSTSCSP